MSSRLSFWLVGLAVLVIAGFGVFSTTAIAAERSAAQMESSAPAAAGEVIKLSAPATTGGGSLNEALATRRSIRSYEDAPISKEDLSQILWAAQGVTDPKTGHRTAPSAMAKYPLEIYAVTADGIFQYVPADHSLKTIKTGDHRSEVTTQAWAKQAALQVVIVGVPERLSRAGDRGKTWVAYEAGAVAENVLLEATALGLGSGTIGGFDPTKVAELMGLPAGNEVVIILPIGKSTLVKTPATAAAMAPAAK